MRPLYRAALFIFTIILCLTVLAGCAQNNKDIQPGELPATFDIPLPAAPGINVEGNDKATIDYSNTKDGYVIVKFIGSTDKTLRVVVNAPHETQYIYALSTGESGAVIPLTEGNGEYKIGVYENIEKDNYTNVLSITTRVELKDEFGPFIRPNQYVNYSRESDLVALAYELTSTKETVKDKIIAIYDYVIDNFTYDYDRAANVQSGYLPNLDEVLENKEGICFDYSALVTAMLRSQGIPARLEIGYHGEEYHAWISLFCEDNGWIDKRYHYDYAQGEWTSMDPTFESTEHHAHKSRQQARDDEEYHLMYNY